MMEFSYTIIETIKKYFSSYKNIYYRLFSIHEIEASKVLQWIFGAILLSYFITYFTWFRSNAFTVEALKYGNYSCWPYFQSCGKLYFLSNLPYGYSQATLYMIFFTLLVTSVYFIHKRDWGLAHLALMPVYIWHFIGVFILTDRHSANYEYFLFFFASILLLIPYKEFFLKIILPLFYFIASTIKFHESWVLGTYFSSLKTGLPLFPDWSIPIWTNMVIFMQIIGSWLLLSRHILLQRIFLIFWIIFHIYSGILVGFRYPVTVLPILIVLFGPFYKPIKKIPLDRKSLAGWLIVVFIVSIQFVHYFIPGDMKLTMEGNKYGLYMFESNHQCINNIKIVTENGHVKEQKRIERASARVRCNPYRYWFMIKNKYCPKLQALYPEYKIHWTLDHSINGGPFYRIVDDNDACSLEYRPFSKNPWIKTEQSAEIIGYPVENIYK